MNDTTRATFTPGPRTLEALRFVGKATSGAIGHTTAAWLRTDLHIPARNIGAMLQRLEDQGLVQGFYRNGRYSVSRSWRITNDGRDALAKADGRESTTPAGQSK